MIALFGTKNDATLGHFRKWLDLNKKAYIWLPQDSYLVDWGLSWSKNKEPTIAFPIICQHPTYAINGIYARLFKPHLDNSIELERYYSLIAYLDDVNISVINRPQFVSKIISKPAQQLILQKIGLETPATIVTNDPNCVVRIHQHWKNTVIKSISGSKTIVTMLNEENLQNVQLVQHCPIELQERIEGANIRVHVIGNFTHAVQIINNSSVDYRYSANSNAINFSSISIPENVELKCKALSRHLSLGFIGVDFIKTRNNNYICLEVNPSPAYQNYEKKINSDILSTALYKYLSKSPSYKEEVK